MARMTVGQVLIHLLEAHGVDTVFGIPGVHTIELYRGLAASRIRHVTPRHEQGAAFMADGYARASGRPGVAFVITGPGLTNALTPMAQARADSIPMLVVSGVNRLDTLGKGLGHLHELPDQRGLAEKVALLSFRVEDGAELPGVLAAAFELFATARPGPVHIEIPLDVMGLPAPDLPALPVAARPAPADPAAVARIAAGLAGAKHPLILAGGGAKAADAELRLLAERLDAPVVTTVNARGLLHRHPLAVHASPSLKSIRALLATADVVLAVGTEFGPTDYDMYADGGFVMPEMLFRIDIDTAQLSRRRAAIVALGDSAEVLSRLVLELGNGRASGVGSARAAVARDAAWNEIEPKMQAQVRAVEAIRDALPGALIVGDSTQPVYAANLYYDHDRPGGWFNAATGYGALGYGPAAAIGAAIARPDLPVVCLTGDGGFQFTLPEIAVAAETAAAVVFVVWNNRGYREIETSMRDAGVEPIGVSPAPPDFLRLAAAYGIPAERIVSVDELGPALRRAREAGGPRLVEIVVE
ncbi:5-guanidino-2-oxopentanoate decarboxylase [Mesorhizobium sp. J428]|uniref:5-guanidino-2-oxopentanoate decarboxylase n=1 Tax=Mesorhizobium sp. J428 TaxID=2898440 RepID=UPI00215173C9|nr:5-guanidino-2-oxopentanoate decarboxylase [Mesorhizobium sp. J428]MCR5857344.1 5-guanidino-2-oxopentanoate decarboxylase [Mesorhizobium sp. J428]